MLSNSLILLGPLLLVAIVIALLAMPPSIDRRMRRAPAGAPAMSHITVSGEVTRLNRADHNYHPVGARVVAVARGRMLGTGTVDEDNRFSFPIPADHRGEIELRIDRPGAAPSLVEAEGHDLVDVVVFYNPVNNWLG